jgi:hypothetical protein
MSRRVLSSRVAQVAAICVAALSSAASASAGTLTLTFNASGGAGCNAGFAMSGGSPFGYGGGCGGWPMGMQGGGSEFTGGMRIAWQTSAPAGISINRASVQLYGVTNVNNGQGWGGGSYYAGGGSGWHNGDMYEYDNNFNSGYWGFQLVCGWAHCTNYGSIDANVIALQATENQGPSLVAVGSSNLWYQGGRWLRNDPASPSWPITLAASDPSGVCQMYAIVNGNTIQGPAASPNTAVWQQCPDPTWTPGGGAAVDTRSSVAGAGPLSLTLAASNAAGVPSQVSETLNVDNDPVQVSLAPSNDPDVSQWVNHAVTVKASTTAGPSGVGGTNCSVDSGPASSYSSSGVTADGTGVHTISCTSWNNAIDPNNQVATGSSSISFKIDETPPSVQFEASNPSSPTQLIVDTSDGQSGVGGGTIEMRPAAGGSWQPLSTQFDGKHLIASFDDAGLTGPYVFQATSCDQVGNCASTSQQLTLPVRLAASSDVSFKNIVNPLQPKKVRERVRVGWHWVTVRRHGKLVRVKRGGHFRTITVVHLVEHCVRKRVRTGKHHWTVRKTCTPPTVQLQGSEQVGFGSPVTVHGLLASRQDVPISGATVEILTAPDNGLSQYTQTATATTDANGAWSATLPPGPSRIIRAVYQGSGTVLPASGQASVTVPARISMSISPRILPWSGTVTIRGQLRGGYVPPDGVALRLLVRYPGSRRGSPLLALRTDANGAFLIKWSFNAGRRVASYPFWISTTATESDYPFAASEGPRISVTFGRRTPAPRRRHQASRHKLGTQAHPHKRHVAKHRRKR